MHLNFIYPLHICLLFDYKQAHRNKNPQDEKQRDLQKVLDVPRVQVGCSGLEGHYTGAAEQGDVQVQRQEGRQGFDNQNKSP